MRKMSDNSQKELEATYKPESAPFSWDKLDGLLAYKSSLIVCADILECHENTIKNHIKKRYGFTFSEYANRKLSRTKLKLVQKALEQANKGNTVMLIFCLKNISGWQDKLEHDISDKAKNAIKLAYNID